MAESLLRVALASIPTGTRQQKQSRDFSTWRLIPSFLGLSGQHIMVEKYGGESCLLLSLTAARKRPEGVRDKMHPSKTGPL